MEQLQVTNLARHFIVVFKALSGKIKNTTIVTRTIKATLLPAAC